MSQLQHLTLHGDAVAYRMEGEGETLLLVHGMAGSSATWRAVFPQLAQRYRVLAPDLPGHGDSAKPRGDYSLGAFAAWLRDLLNELGIERVTVIGQSLGGGVAMQFSYQHPELCDRLVLIGSGGLGPDVNWTLRLLAAPGSELSCPWWRPPWFVTPETRSVAGWRRPGSTRSAATRCGTPTRRCPIRPPGRRFCGRSARSSTIGGRR